MAGQTATNQQFNPYLSSTQQDLLLAALTSNYSKTKNNSYPVQNPPTQHRSNSDSTQQPQLDGAMFTSPQQVPPSGTLSTYDYDESPYLDYIDGDTSFDFDDSTLDGQQMIGSLPGDNSQTSGSEEKGDKRKSPGEGNADRDNDAKRREGEDKMAKKPGRKPLTSEPTTKRKAQNRAAQRAFRERKEKHLKDLETKVTELTKAQEADKHENGVLRAQVERLQQELKEYRQRMSMNGGATRSPPAMAQALSSRGNGIANNFQFEFPKFGALPGSHILGNPAYGANGIKRENVSPPIAGSPGTIGSLNGYNTSRVDSTNGSSQPQSQNVSAGQSPSNNYSQSNSRSGSMNSGPRDSVNNANLNSLQNNLTQTPNANNGFAGSFSPSLLQNGSGVDYGFPNNVQPQTQDNGTDSNSGLSRVFRFNSGSTTSNTASPSASSQSQWNPNSSCGTSPEPSHDSPPSDQKQHHNANQNKNTQQTGVTTQHPANRVPTTDVNGIDWLATQNGGLFDPVLFGDYRESQEAIVGDGNFDNGFFNDAFPLDFGSPLNFGDIQSPPKQQQNQQVPASRNFSAEVERAREGNDDDDLLPMHQQQQQMQQKQNQPQTITPGKMMNCNTIWNQLQSNQDFQEGKFDLDSLCSELRAKAKCSESGVMVNSNHVDAALKKLGSGAEDTDPNLVWEQSYFDDALRKSGGGGADNKYSSLQM